MYLYLLLLIIGIVIGVLGTHFVNGKSKKIVKFTLTVLMDVLTSIEDGKSISPNRFFYLLLSRLDQINDNNLSDMLKDIIGDFLLEEYDVE